MSVLKSYIQLLTAEVAGRRPINSRFLTLFAAAGRAWRCRSIRSIRQPSWMNVALGSLGSWLLATALTAIPAKGAERISLVYGPLKNSLSVKALEIYAREGRITDEFAFYARHINPQQQTALRAMLQTRFEASLTTVSQFTYSSMGETVLARLGQIIQTESGQNGFYALRAAFILAAADREGFSVLNVVRQFPTRGIQIDVNRVLQISREMAQSLKKREAIIAAIQQQALAEAASAVPVDFSERADLRLPGSFTWRQETLTLDDRSRNRVFLADIYLPQPRNQGALMPAAPLIVISHGAAEDRQTFAYLAQHLASYGFAVAVLEHPGISAQRFGQFYAGLAGQPETTELINQPLDVKYLLDELQRRSEPDQVWHGQLNLQQVGVIGQSLGGYTALTLAGAKLNFAKLHQDCGRVEPGITALNLSLLVQCEATKLSPSTYDLQDKRVKAVIAVNPVTSSILGESGLSQIQVPAMLVAGTKDFVTPAVPEQIQAFAWLTGTQDKYLVVVEKGTHFSMLDKSAVSGGALPQLPATLIGPDPALARSYLKALSVAFAQTYVANRPEYKPYLKAAYAKALGQAPLGLSLVQLLTAKQLAQVLNGSPPQSAASSQSQLPSTSP